MCISSTPITLRRRIVRIVATTTDYGQSFVSSIATDRLFACQFHPEKSQELGLRILANFGRFVETIEIEINTMISSC